MTNSKDEIIKELTNTGVLNSGFNHFEDDDVDYKFCINYFKKWCKFINCEFNYTSFYYFLLEYDEISISNENVLIFNSGSKISIIDFDDFTWYDEGLSERIKDSDFYKLL